MAITAGQTALAADFISSTSGAGDAGKVPKLNSLGKLDASFLKFGGTGVDGALSITSGATNIDLGNAATVIKNYTSISITGTGSLTFTNPHTNGTVIILKSQGNVTLTSSAAPMIDCSGLGAAGGAAIGPTGSSIAGNSGESAVGFAMFRTNGAVANVSSSVDGTAGAAVSTEYVSSTPSILTGKYPFSISGAGGSSGGVVGGAGSTSTSGAGGRGGGALIIECAGAWNFTTTNGISVAGKNGGNGARNTGSNGGAGGGGGGGGGVFVCSYNTLTANSGTINISGGNPGTQAFAGGTGGGGGSFRAAGSGTTGASGYFTVTANTEFA